MDFVPSAVLGKENGKVNAFSHNATVPLSNSQALKPPSAAASQSNNTHNKRQNNNNDDDAAASLLTSAMGALKINHNKNKNADEEKELMKKDWKEELSEMDKMFEQQAAEKLAKLGQVSVSTDLLEHIQLMPHQVDGVAWMVSQERCKEPPSFWYETIAASGHSKWRTRMNGFKWRDTAPPPIRGGILGDDMGLGKTVQCMALICANLPQSRDPTCTMIVAPVSVLGTWSFHFKTYAKKSPFRVRTLQDANYDRVNDLVQSKKPTLLLVSYERLASIMKKAPDILENNRFFRVILDEAHNIRNPSGKAFQAACKIKTKHRWAITGSPFVNKPDDIASLLSFLQVAPLSERDEFRLKITDPIKDKKMIGLARLRTVVAHVVLRRSKHNVNTGIPKKTIHIHKVDYSTCINHEMLYDRLYNDARDLVIENQKAEKGERESMLGKVNRVRQICSDMRLVPEELRIGIEPVVGPKIKSILEIIETTMQLDEKAVIFSEWTSFLNLVEKAFDEVGHRYTRIDGTMKASERQEAMEAFNGDVDMSKDGKMKGPRFILCSLKAAGVGITLTRANVVFLTSSWWNHAEENQASDRVHRIGQTRAVNVYRMVVKDSIEERMLDVQEAKSALGKGTFSKLKKSELDKAKVTAMRDLFEVSDTVNSWDAHDASFFADED